MKINILDKLEIRTINKKYKYETPVSGGQSSWSFFGKNITTNEDVFIKFLIFPRSKTEISRFRHEAFALNLLCNLSSTATPKLIDHGEIYEGEVLYLVTEKVDGETLSNWLLKNINHATLEEKLHLFHRIVSAMSSCTLFSHRDLHPGNIIILNEDPDWHETIPKHEIKIVDWGQSYNPTLAHYEDTPEFINHLAERIPKEITSSFYSTPPEVFTPWKDSAYHPAKHDAWSLGLLLYKMLTGNDAINFIGIGDYAKSLATKQLQRVISEKTWELKQRFDNENLLLPRLFNGLATIDPAHRLSPGLTSRILWDIRIEGFRPKNEDEALSYLRNPYSFTPSQGWKFSFQQDYD